MKALVLAACLFASTAFAQEIIINGNFPPRGPEDVVGLSVASEQKFTSHTYIIDFIDSKYKVFEAYAGYPWSFRSD